ncbi:MAG: glycoside hydrolase family 97 catalytic domain-containing protein, partial [Duncaniella sp.]|nr:glycoside hydrolase family 97 catalytic domain-containing protein [Duncaniella sp.]
KDGRPMSVEFMVGDNDVAFRYCIPRSKESGSVRVTSEETGYRLPAGTTTFLTPQSDAMIGWKRTKPSYEEKYKADAPMDTPSQYGRGYTFPALFHTPSDGWVLLSETGVDSRYCGSRLGDFKEGYYKIEFPMAEENNGNGTSEPAFALPGSTPWRTITVGKSLAPIAETTVMWDVTEPLYSPSTAYEPGRGTWSWILWQDKSINFEDQVRYIDLAASMGYEYTLVDNWWDTNIGREGIEKLSRYAQSKGVSLLIWYSSSGWWNDIRQGPVNRMDNPIARKAEMKWLRTIGVKGIKVDFFGGDKQETMRLYEQILSDADDFGLMVIFHGCTMPRGWERMYPNYVGSEAVLASENMVFTQDACDEEAFNATLHPFIRNMAGSMEFGGTFLNRRLNRGNDGGSVRRTTDIFQLATAVLFQNPAQNFALAPNNLTDSPPLCIEFMKSVPTRWDDTRYVAGYPGRYAMLARRHGATWYAAAVNALSESVDIEADLGMMAGREATLYLDGEAGPESKTVTIPRDGRLIVPVRPQGGAVIVCKTEPSASGRIYPERQDDLAWENNLVGFRAYGPATRRKGEKSYGYDIFFKYPDKGLVVEELYSNQCSKANWAKADSLKKADPELAKAFINTFTYHADNGKGMDCYAVGPTLGCGASAILLGDSLVYSWCHESAEILESDTDRFRALLTYPAKAIGRAGNVVERRLISLEKDSYLNRCEVYFEGLEEPCEIAVGFPLRDDSEIKTDTKRGIVAYADPTQGPANGKALLGIVVPGGADRIETHDGHILAVKKIEPGSYLTYYWGFAWDRCDIRDMKQWSKYLENYLK